MSAVCHFGSEHTQLFYHLSAWASTFVFSLAPTLRIIAQKGPTGATELEAITWDGTSGVREDPAVAILNHWASVTSVKNLVELLRQDSRRGKVILTRRQTQ